MVYKLILIMLAHTYCYCPNSDVLILLSDPTSRSAASFIQPQGIYVDSAGNLHVADTYNNRIRRISATNGTISTIAGSPQPNNHPSIAVTTLVTPPSLPTDPPVRARPPIRPKTISEIIVDLSKTLTRNPKRPGRGFTVQELGAAAVITQNVLGTSQINYLTALQLIFSPERSCSLLESIINDISLIESMQKAIETQEKMQQKLETFTIPLMRYEHTRQIVKEAINTIVKRRYTEASERTIAREDTTFYKLLCDRDDYQKVIRTTITFLHTFHPHKLETWTEAFLDASENESKSLKERVAVAMRNIGDKEISQLWEGETIIVRNNTTPQPINLDAAPLSVISIPLSGSGSLNRVGMGTLPISSISPNMPPVNLETSTLSINTNTNSL